MIYDDKMDDEIRSNIVNWIEFYKDDVPNGYALLQGTELSRLEDVITFLINLFAKEEEAIRQMRSKSQFSGADRYEEGVRSFASMAVKQIILAHERLKENSKYRNLLGQKHMAYGFFHELHSGYLERKEILDEQEFYEVLYMGLIEFYDSFYGQFGDNEEAIILLCRYYPKEIWKERPVQNFALVLYKHISNAGTPNDTGYAYHGIALIKDNIQSLPVAVVRELLLQYAMFELINNSVRRHQIYTIINFSLMRNDEKETAKFWFLDSLLLADRINQFLPEKIKEQNREVIYHYLDFDDDMSNEKLKVLEEPNVYWSNREIEETMGIGKSVERHLFLNEKPIIKIVFQTDVITIEYVDKGSKPVQLPYVYSDWQLERYRLKKTEEQIKEFVFGRKIGLVYRQMFFSLLYVDNYRGMKDQIIDFDHRFRYDWKNRCLKEQKRQSYPIPHFYGEAVYSLSCIVGKNGTGKTSTVDFLRESFFKLLKVIQVTELPCENGCVEEKYYKSYIRLDNGARFLVVFSMGEDTFFLTNIKGVDSRKVQPFQKDIYGSDNEFSKVVYFSNMLKSDQRDLFFEVDFGADNDEESAEKKKAAQIFSEFRQADYSETGSFIRKRKAIEMFQTSKQKPKGEITGKRKKMAEQQEKQMEESNGINRELCYQFTFLRNCDMDKLQEYLSLDKSKEFKVSSALDKIDEDYFKLSDLKENIAKINELEKKYLFLPDAQIQYFSSGQYNKFSFLAKLYWFLEGYQKEIERYKTFVGNNQFSNNDVLMKDETALVFIDEGELYYHPEWQRRYIKTLLEMINHKEYGYRIQIVITTNSPFILSDILKEDVIYLGEDKGKVDKSENTLGQNIHRLLMKNFFMDYTIGEYAREVIEKVTGCLENVEKQDEAQEQESGKEKQPEQEEQEQKSQREMIENLVADYFGEINHYLAFRTLIDQIGEPVYRYELEKLLEESAMMESQRRIEELQEEKRKIEEKIKLLEEKELI